MTQVKTYPGADCNSDHVPVVATVKLRLKKLTKSTKKSNWQLTALKDENIKNRYNIEVKNTYETLQDIGNDTA